MKSLVTFFAAMIVAVALFNTSAKAMEASAPAAQKLMKDYFGNTRICREDLLFECHMWLNPDGTFILIGYNRYDVNPPPEPSAGGGHGDGFKIEHGTWTIEGKPGAYKLCRKMSTATRAGCEGEPGMKLGDTFVKYHDSGQLKGTTEHYALVRGHV